ncbi:MAG: hypothetical protein AVDCRST_MAG08-4244 [uncultured Acetobacteraceae bacterium]|uniref:Uncharacterized protein n=1 Tax=uncultured Acetobacteraceae bacterium TaxID=169975 RepID=A0A6J4JS99_9PROT|nr:MAG: hypothetical protein AVDCRST_MAG08-4244 [uncultured Acetobacteraceae bacterium]
MPRRPAIAATVAAALLALPAGAGAQTRTVVVPAGEAVVVPPRGSALPRPAVKPVAQRPRLPPMAPASEAGGLNLGGAGAVAGVVLPAIAAAALTAVLSNGGTGGGNHGASGPARTR